MRGTRTGRAIEFIRTGLGKTLRRPDVALTILMTAVPLLVLVGAGLLFIYRQGYALQYAGLVVFCVLMLWSIRRFHRRRRSFEPLGDGISAEVQPDPSWGSHEREVFHRVCRRNLQRTSELNNWDEDLVRLGCEVADDVAQQLSRGRRGSLDVTVPEILGLVEQVQGEFRELATAPVVAPLLRNVSVSNILWVLKNRRRLAQAAEDGKSLVDLARIAINPPAGVVLIIESMIADGSFRYLSVQSQIELQRTMLDFVAAKSIDLYSGRFRNAVQAGLPHAVAEPIRILLAGQAGAGKSSLAAAVAGALTAGSSAPPDPGRVFLQGQQCTIVEAPGFASVGEAGLRSRLTNWMRPRSTREDANNDEIEKLFLDCDMLVWVLRADQPARKADADALKRFQAAFEQRTRRRMPPLLVAVTHVDRPPLIESWPTNDDLSPPQQLKIERVTAASARALGQPGAIPLKLTAPNWNLDELLRQMAAELPEACYSQNNRLRAGSDRDSKGIATAALSKQKRRRGGNEVDAALPTDGDQARVRTASAGKGLARLRIRAGFKKLRRRARVGKWRRDES